MKSMNFLRIILRLSLVFSVYFVTAANKTDEDIRNKKSIAHIVHLGGELLLNLLKVIKLTGSGVSVSEANALVPLYKNGVTCTCYHDRYCANIKYLNID